MAWILSRPSGIPDPIQVGAFGKSVTLTFGTSVPVDFSKASTVVLTATTNAAFTFGAPIHLVNGQFVTFMVRNTSGVALSATNPFSNAIYKLATWTQPGTGSSRSISYIYNGTNLVEVSRTAADIPN